MWIVRVALTRPYTFIVLAILILIASPVVIHRMPTDIFPNIDIPVVASDWTYTGLSPQEFEGRIVSSYERSLSTTVSDIEHIESQTLNGMSVIKIFFQPSVNINAAIAQVTAISQTVLKQMPPGITPPLVMNYNASTVPILQLSLSSPSLSEQELTDLGMNFMRSQLATVAGAAVPWPFGGKTPQVMVDVNPALLQANGLSPLDVVNAVSVQNLILPAGTAKIGAYEYNVDMNASPRTVQEIADLPVKAMNGSTIYLHDLGSVRNGFAPQSNIVRQDGRRGALLIVYKSGNASTLDIVSGVRKLLPVIKAALPKDLKITPLADQSIFVRAAISGVVREAIIAACLTAVMILLFLGSWRSTLIIAISIPLSILSSILVLAGLHETINIMTLGGLALAVGILVDDATVTIENIERHIELGMPLETAIFEGAAQISVPALVSTLCICIVFLPMFFLNGVPRYLFVPLAEAVVFAMLASYILSRTLVPTLAKYLLKAHGGRRGGSRWNPFTSFQRSFERGFMALRRNYSAMLATALRHRGIFLPSFLLVCLTAFLLVPWLGQDFFPTVDTGQIKLHLRAPTGTRIEETARLCDLVDASIRRTIPASEMQGILDNIGLPYSPINLTYSNSAPIGSEDADILVTLNENHRPTSTYVEALSQRLSREFPEATFAFLPADMVSQILNFGLPAPIDVQIVGPDVQADRKFADTLLNRMRHVPGAADLRIQQAFDQPKFHIQVDRTKAAEAGFTQRDIANNLLVSLSGSLQTTPSYWLNPKNGVSYSLVTQTPQYRIQTLHDIEDVPITGPGARQPEILADVASIRRDQEMAVVSHFNVLRVVDIYGSVRDRDLGAVGAELERIIDANRDQLPPAARIFVRGQLTTMRDAYVNLLGGLLFSIVLVYLLIVVNFQSWLDPFIIITALPAALAGIVLFLFLTHTTLSVPALMGAIMCMGVATANSILVVSFAKDRLVETGNSVTAALEAGATRFRPVLMTALAMIIGMVPMALGLGEGGEQNAPLGRAVIGGLICATVATLFFVPGVFSLLHRNYQRAGE
ncbi:MAG TPA: efflux RND transporter permease subunit [Verrucomicrobiae bacterium]|nr:efflux RND transporter permease subunit [Verrucomicrobiae bacterium]